MTESTPGLSDAVAAPQDAAQFDVWDPANISPLVAYLAVEDCRRPGASSSSRRHRPQLPELDDDRRAREVRPLDRGGAAGGDAQARRVSRATRPRSRRTATRARRRRSLLGALDEPEVLFDARADPGAGALAPSCGSVRRRPLALLLRRRVQQRATASPRYQWWVLWASSPGCSRSTSPSPSSSSRCDGRPPAPHEHLGAHLGGHRSAPRLRSRSAHLRQGGRPVRPPPSLPARPLRAMVSAVLTRSRPTSASCCSPGPRRRPGRSHRDGVDGPHHAPLRSRGPGEGTRVVVPRRRRRPRARRHRRLAGHRVHRLAGAVLGPARAALHLRRRGRPDSPRPRPPRRRRGARRGPGGGQPLEGHGLGRDLEPLCRGHLAHARPLGRPAGRWSSAGTIGALCVSVVAFFVFVWRIRRPSIPSSRPSTSSGATSASDRGAHVDGVRLLRGVLPLPAHDGGGVHYRIAQVGLLSAARPSCSP